jgi:hypothetical protein
MISGLLLVASWAIAVPGVFWGVYVRRRHIAWRLSFEEGMLVALLPPFILSLGCAVASVLCK